MTGVLAPLAAVVVTVVDETVAVTLLVAFATTGFDAATTAGFSSSSCRFFSTDSNGSPSCAIYKFQVVFFLCVCVFQNEMLIKFAISVEQLRNLLTTATASRLSQRRRRTKQLFIQRRTQKVIRYTCREENTIHIKNKKKHI